MATSEKPTTAKTKQERRTPQNEEPIGRRGAPRPMAAHIAAGLADLQQGVALAAAMDDPRFPWRASLEDAAEKLKNELRVIESQCDKATTRRIFARETAKTAVQDVRRALGGIDAYRKATPLRRPAAPKTLWNEGSARLLDFHPDASTAAPTALFLPSLVNSPAILDLSRARSMMRGLSKYGVRALLLDWGAPSGDERKFGAADYVLQRAAPALRAANRVAGGPVHLAGHCMGGALAAGLATLEPSRVASLALLATPWDFRAIKPNLRPAKDALERLIAVSGRVFGGMPPDFLNTIFFLNDPIQAMRKFPRAAQIAKRGPAERLFLAVEDWLNDGRLLAAPTARDLFVHWGYENALAQGEWAIASADGERRLVKLSDLNCDVLIAASRTDTLTPFSSARSAFVTAPSARLIRPSGGHIGMIVGSRAEQELWRPYAEWINRR